MLAAAADATATPAPASHRRLANVFSRLAFRYPARDMGVIGCRMVSGLLHAFRLPDDFGAGSARKDGGLMTRRCAARGGERSLSLAFAFGFGN